MRKNSVFCSLRRLGRIGTRSLSSNSHNTFISVADLLQSRALNNPDVTITGFVRSIRKQKTISFAAIGDGTSLRPLQALLTPAQAESLSTGTAVQLTGKWKPSPGHTQSHELHVESVDIIGASDPATFPLQKKYHTPEFLRTIPHLRTRTPLNSLLLRFRSQSIAQITKFFAEQEFIQTHPPIITSSDCEGAGEVFGVSTGNTKTSAVSTTAVDEGFFRSPKYLTVSNQLHLEALAQSVGKVWTLSPTFRAEKSDTPRHLSEFYMLEAEISFVDQLESVMRTVEMMLQDLTTNLFETKVGEELLHGKRSGENGMEPPSKQIEERWHGMMSPKWPRITYTEAIDMLQKSTVQFEHKPIWGQSLQAEHERFIASNVGRGAPVFVTHYPRNIKPFYMLPSATTTTNSPKSMTESETVECFDLLVPEICEIVGGSMREHRLPQLLESMREHGLITRTAEGGEESLGSLQWYADLRKWGSTPHGGFGLGFDRLVGYLAGVGNIRDVVAFPRWVGRCDC